MAKSEPSVDRTRYGHEAPLALYHLKGLGHDKISDFIGGEQEAVNSRKERRALLTTNWRKFQSEHKRC